MARPLDVDGNLLIETPAGKVVLTGRGSTIEVNLPSGTGTLAMFRLVSPWRRNLRVLVQILEAGDISMDFLRAGRIIAQLGPSVPRVSLLRIFGLRGCHVRPLALLRSSAFPGRPPRS